MKFFITFGILANLLSSAAIAQENAYKTCNETIALGERVGGKNITFGNDGKVSNPQDFGTFDETANPKVYENKSSGEIYKVHYTDSKPSALEFNSIRGFFKYIQFGFSDGKCKPLTKFEGITSPEQGFFQDIESCSLIKHMIDTKGYTSLVKLSERMIEARKNNSELFENLKFSKPQFRSYGNVGLTTPYEMLLDQMKISNKKNPIVIEFETDQGELEKVINEYKAAEEEIKNSPEKSAEYTKRFNTLTEKANISYGRYQALMETRPIETLALYANTFFKDNCSAFPKEVFETQERVSKKPAGKTTRGKAQAQ